jgi:hypothetical protein
MADQRRRPLAHESDSRVSLLALADPADGKRFGEEGPPLLSASLGADAGLAAEIARKAEASGDLWLR